MEFPLIHDFVKNIAFVCIFLAEDADHRGFMYYVNDGVYGSFNCILFDHNNPVGMPLFVSGRKLSDGLLAQRIFFVSGRNCRGIPNNDLGTDLRQPRQD